MTVTKRKRDSSAGGAQVLESGTRASCDGCSLEVTHTVHIRCAETVNEQSNKLTCPDFDLCVPCFLSGRNVGTHKAGHAYRIIDSHAFPIFDRDWGADEELLMIEGAELYGLGNWADIAEHIGARTKEECKEHYYKVYIDSDDYPLPRTSAHKERDFGTQQDFAQRKKARLEEMHNRPIDLPPPKPLASAPTCHEVAGFMPGRLEFETEYENDAETLIKDLEFGRVYRFGGDAQPAALPSTAAATTTTTSTATNGGGEEKAAGIEIEDEPEEDLELKLAVLEMFNERIEKRMLSKEFMFDRGLMGYRQLTANERKRTKEERDVIQRSKVFARLETAKDHEEFVDGLLFESTLKKRIAELQEYRRMGITSHAEAERYEHAKQQRTTHKANQHRLALASSSSSKDKRALMSSSSSTTAGGGGGSASSKRPPAALTLSNSASLHLLMPIEAQLCSTLRILPRPYLFLKETIVREWLRTNGRLTAGDVRLWIERGRDQEWGEKIERVFEFLDVIGLLPPAPPIAAAATAIPPMTNGTGTKGDMSQQQVHAPTDDVHMVSAT